MKKDYKIIVNTGWYEWGTDHISYDEVIKLVYPNYDENDPNIEYDVTVSNSVDFEGAKRLSKGDIVKIKNEKTIFNVGSTDKS